MIDGERTRGHEPPSRGLPKLPRGRPSRLVQAYGLLGGLLLAGYLWAGFSGFAFDSEEHSQVPPSVRQSPGGYRSYHLWYAGYSGGK